MTTDTLQELTRRPYEAGFVTEVESDTFPPGLTEDVIRQLSEKKGEPAFMLEWRLKAFRRWTRMREPGWAQVRYPPIDFQAISYYSAPKQRGDGPKSLADVDPKLLETYDKLGIPLHERARLAGGAGHLGAVIAGVDREAVAEVERAFALALQAPETWLVYGRALQGLRRFSEAENALRQAIAKRPAYADALRDLCQLIWMQSGDAQAALAPIDAAMGAAGEQPAAIPVLAGVKIRLLNHLSGEAPALAFAQEALARSPDDPRLALETAALLLSSAPERSRELSAAVLARNPRDPTARRAMTHAHLALGEAALAAQIAEELLSENPIDQEAAAALATARRLAGDERYRDLWDYEALVAAQTIDTPAGWASLETYLSDLRGALAELHALQAHPIEQSVRGGTQTSQNLLAAEHPAIRAFFEAVEGPIRAYRAAIGLGEDMFRARNGGGHRVLGAWSVRLKPGGFHVDHIHPQGWISSACYIDVPEAVGAGEDRAGWLRFGAAPIPTRPRLEAEHFVRPQPGLLALFPSYMWHGTVPFGGDQVRTTIAFDVVPD